MGANEKHDATYHGYTPSTEIVRVLFKIGRVTRKSDVGTKQMDDEFTRWLETVRAEAKAEALTEMAKLIESKAKILDPEDPTQRGARIGLITAGCDLNFRANQYKENQS